MTGQITKNFSWEEMEYSQTAQRKGIDNTIPEALRGNMYRLCKEVLQPIRDAWGKPIVVSSGYRCAKLNKAVGGVSTSQHCLDEQTEILTTMGWRKYDELSEGETIFSYNIESGKIDVVPIDELIIYHYKGKMMRMNTAHVDALVTDGHRMLVRYASNKYVRHNTKNITPEGQKYFDSLKTDNDKWHIETAKEVFGRRRQYKSAGITASDLPLEGDFGFLKLAMAFVADGYYHFRKDWLCGGGFRFKKERKIARVKYLLESLGLHYTTRIDKHGVFEFYLNNSVVKPLFEILGRNKDIPTWFMLLSAERLQELLNEYIGFDGHIPTHTDGNYRSISTINAHNRDMLQGMCALCGWRCSYGVQPAREYNIKGQRGPAKECYHLSVVPTRDESRVSENQYSWEDYDGIVWCANNRNTTLITRRNGKVLFIGNCSGSAADVHTVENTLTANGRLWDLIIDLAKAGKIKCRQIIWEYGDIKKGCRWIHLSVNDNTHTKQENKVVYIGV